MTPASVSEEIYNASNLGASAVLLIAGVLKDKNLIKDAAELARYFQMDAVLEVHDASELELIEGIPGIIGINNRNLKTGSIDLDTTMRLTSLIPGDDTRVVVSESGISGPEDIIHLRQTGATGFLIGTAFVKHINAGRELKRFIGEDK